MRKFVAYYRVSTQKQGRSGLGLEAQRQSVRDFVKHQPIVAEFTEVESGKNNQRQQLRLAIDSAKQHGATLIIAKLDRLSRNASFIFALRDSGVDFQCVDLPDANTLTIGIFATLAQHERELISSRTKAGLAIKKRQGIKLGNPDNLTEEGKRKGRQVGIQRAHANENNQRASAMISRLKKDGMNYLAIATELNRTNFRTAQGKLFGATQVKRLYLRSLSPADKG